MKTSSSYQHSDEISGSLQAAGRIVPIILDIVGKIHSVVDLGGGSGAWLKVFQQYGAEQILLYDALDVVPELLIEPEFFQPIDLNQTLPNTAHFDLALCIECAEHLRPDRAGALVEWLTSVSDRVIFSSALPKQGGKHHVNERPPWYWNQLFQENGFVRRDVIRGRIVHDSEIPWFYRQNVVMYIKAGVSLNIAAEDFLPDDFQLVHQIIATNYQREDVSYLARSLAKSILDKLKRA